MAIQFKKHRITAFVPHYNHHEFLPDAIEGLLSQTIKPNRIFVVDDRSTDESYGCVLAYFKNHAKKTNESTRIPNDPTSVVDEYHNYQIGGVEIVLVRVKKNGGRAFACNVAIKETIELTDVYAICDADDIYYPTKIEKSLKILEKHPEVGVVYTDIMGWDTRKNEKNYDYYRSFDYELMCRRNCCNNNSIVVAQIFKLVGLYDEELKVAEDYDMWLRMAEACAFYHIPEALFIYRVHGNNESLTTKQDVWRQCLNHLHQKRLYRAKGDKDVQKRPE